MPDGSELRRAVFLDRDGVLVETKVRDGVPRPSESRDELALLPGVGDACEALKSAGFVLVVVTNQPDIARGTISAEMVELLNDHLRRVLPLDEVVVCPHDDADGCRCRKPRPGMLVDAAERLGLDLAASFMVGDRWRDVGAGRGAGCRVVFVDLGYAETLSEPADAIVPGLPAAADWILSVC